MDYLLKIISGIFSPEHWLLVAFVAPVFWSLVNIIDVYFVGGIYNDEYDGSIISSLFQMLPWTILIFAVDINFSPFIGFSPNGSFHFNPALGMAFLGGILFSLSFFFYFKALFKENDAPMLQIIWILNIALVPVLTFFLFGEKLGLWKYLGMGVIFLGAFLLSFNPKMKNKLSRKYLFIMSGAVVFLAISMVLAERAYILLGAESLRSGGFWVGFLFFSLGYFFWGVLLVAWKKRNIFPMVGKYWKIFLLAEGVSFLGTMGSQRAIDISPSVSYVAAIETLSPAFVVLFSFGMAGYFFLKKDPNFHKIFSEQTEALWVKIISVAIMTLGVYLISS
jgi:drug/metabolite transporter (DMT)-like permease